MVLLGLLGGFELGYGAIGDGSVWCRFGWLWGHRSLSGIGP